MFSWKKEEKPKPKPRRNNLSQFGLMDIPDDFDAMGGGMDDGDDDDDEDLEAELAALTSGSAKPRPKRKPAVPAVNLDAMVASSMRDIPSDGESSADENDPELLAELGELVSDEEAPPAPAPAPVPAAVVQPSATNQVAVLEQRLAMYRQAEENAKKAGEAARARRFNRGLKTLMDQLKQAKAGKVIPEDEIPPEVAISITKKEEPPVPGGSAPVEPESALPAPMAPLRPAPPPPTPAQVSTPSPAPPQPVAPSGASDDGNQLAELLKRQLQFKQAALSAKKSGDSETAIKYLRISKQFDSVIAAVKSGNPVDMTEMPQCSNIESPAANPTPPQVIQPPPSVPSRPQEAEVQQGPSEEPPPAPKGPSLPEELLNPPAPSNVTEALAQRLARYQAEEKLAKDSGNSSKARRMGRITKQYQDAIKMHKAGKPIPVDELPTPPGFAPIPVPGATAPPPAAPDSGPEDGPSTAPPAAASSKPVGPPTPPKVAKTSTPETPSSAGLQRQASEVRKSPQSRVEKQIALLLERQREFKEAALMAKKQGELDQAREFLRQAKGFDSLIQASQSGLPVDLASLPVSPKAAATLDNIDDFEYVTMDDCTPGGNAEIYEKLEEDLTKQFKLCLATRDHFKATGDVAGANRFEQLAVQSKRDLSMVKACRQRGETLPRFRYETRSFSILQCCTDLGDNDIELNIVQGVSFNVPNPKEVDTYVRFEFPFPSENPPKDKTALIKDTNSPQYNYKCTLAIARTARACQRVFKRQGVKLEVWSKGGFLRGDTLLGTAVVKLQPLETKCILHDTFPLMDGRKAVGGQLEVKIRVRHPLVTRQVEQRQERWLVVAPE